MPYTAPLKTTPSAQHIEHSDPSTPPSPGSPTVTDTHGATTLNLPHSYSSTSYVRRHRRCSSSSKSFVFPAQDNNWDSSPIIALDSYASIRQSPPPVSEGPIPPGALLSPPESGQNSSDEESAHRPREELHLEELEAAVRSIEQRRMSSPERRPLESRPTMSGRSVSPNSGRLSRPTLTRDNRKVSHSRSFVESSISRKRDEALTSSPEESDRDDEPKPKHPMVRKKSGELVRPALRPPSSRRRPSSMPGTPTFSKAVHFDAQLEHIRHFLQLDKPQAVSAGSSPVEDLNADGEYPFNSEPSDLPQFEWELHLSNFPRHPAPSNTHHRVRLERLYLSQDKGSLVGTVVVANIAYHKHVAARFTFDNWKTTSEVTAEYKHDAQWNQAHDGYDQFSFSIRLDEQTNLEKKTMFVCVRYNVDGQEFWDNNGHRNYQVNFTKVSRPKPRNQGIPNARPRINLPRSRSSTGLASRHSMPSSLKDFSDMHRYISFGPPKNDRKDKPEDDVYMTHDAEAPVPIRRDKQSHQIFGNRYDFESSLSAAMRSKPEHDRTTLAARAKSEIPTSRSHSQDLTGGSGWRAASPSAQQNKPQSEESEHEKPSSLASGKPNRESSVYKELVDRYCFYGSPNLSPNPSPHLRLTESGSSNNPSSSSSPSSSSPGTYSPKETTDVSQTISGTPPTIGYKYFEPMQDNFLKETHTPAIIRG